MNPTPATARTALPPSTAPTADSELTWLLHRAAQRLRTAVGEHAAAHGVNLGDHIVLSALHKTPDLTQSELGRAVGLDKTTLTARLDRLESAGLVERRVDPEDRRARIPRITSSGDAVRAQIAVETDRTETALTQRYTPAEVTLVKRVLYDLIGDTYDPGSCF